MTVVNFLFDIICIRSKPKKVGAKPYQSLSPVNANAKKKGNILKFLVDQGMVVGLNWAIS